MYFVANILTYLDRRSETKHEAIKFDIPSFFGNRIRFIDQLKIVRDSNLRLVERDKDISCPRSAVKTIIHKASDVVRKVAWDPIWCLVIVGDRNAPLKAEYIGLLRKMQILEPLLTTASV